MSATAVSFVINGRADGSIGPETQQRILDAVAKLGYRPNLAAQALRTRRSRTIGFVTDEIAVKAPGGQSISAIHDVARQHGSVVLIVNATREQKVLRRAVDDLLDRQVDAIVFAAVGTKRATVPESLRHVPTVLVNCFSTGDGLPSIVPDEASGGRDATELALTAAVTAGSPSSPAGLDRGRRSERLKGYRAALQDRRHRRRRRRSVLEGNFRADSGLRPDPPAARRGRRRPTAIVCGNDLMALGAYFAVNEHGLRVPDDVSVVGYDDLEDVAAHIQPGAVDDPPAVLRDGPAGGRAPPRRHRRFVAPTDARRPAPPCRAGRSVRRRRPVDLGARRAGELAAGDDGEHDGDADGPGERDPQRRCPGRSRCRARGRRR